MLFRYLCLGSEWRNLPDSFPDWRIVYYYFRKWKADGTLETLNLGLNRLARRRIGKKATPAMFCIGFQSIKVAPLSGYMHRMKKILADDAYKENFSLN